MRNVSASYRRRHRRLWAVGSTAGLAVLLMVASAAWACTILVGTFTVCNPPQGGFNSEECSQRVGTGTQSGLVQVETGGSAVSVVGSGFDSSVTDYSITFAVAGPSCHAFNEDLGVTSLLGTDGSGDPNVVAGPSFDVGNGSGDYPDVSTPAVSLPGLYSFCVQDEPERVDGNAVHGVVML